MSRATGVPIPQTIRSSAKTHSAPRTGVHAAAVIKAYKKNDEILANTIYSGVPSHFFGLEQVIDIGPMSGKSNVHFWLQQRGISDGDEVVDRIFERAKRSPRNLTEAEILECCRAAGALAS